MRFARRIGLIRLDCARLDPDSKTRLRGRPFFQRAVNPWVAQASAILLAAGCAACAGAADKPAGGKALTPGKLVVDPGSFSCLSFRWFVEGDSNFNATLKAVFREAGNAEGAWQDAYPFMRVNQQEAPRSDKKMTKWRKGKRYPNLLAGSILHLKPGATYEVKLTLADPDGGGEEKTVQARTRALPRIPDDLTRVEATPETIADNLKEVKAGTRLVLQPGTYPPLHIAAKGSADAPLVVEGADRSKVIVKGAGGVSLTAPHVWVRKLTIRDAKDGVTVKGAHESIVSECDIQAAQYGVLIDRADGVIVMDNIVKGPCTWPRTKGIERPHGIETEGANLIITHNRVSGFADGISNNNYYEGVNWEVSYNDVSECTDDGIEVDFCSQNARIFRNRFTNCFQTVSVAPTLGGPIYILRNEIYNTYTPYKMQRCPTGLLVFNNTSYSFRHAMYSPAAERWYRVKFRNNLLFGAGAKVMEVTPGREGVDFDFAGFTPQEEGRPFMKWDGKNYMTFEELKKAGHFKNSIVVNTDICKNAPKPKYTTEPAQAGTYKPDAFDFALVEDAAAIDKGQAVPNLLGPVTGKPDLGAREFGSAAPHFGPRGYASPNEIVPDRP